MFTRDFLLRVRRRSLRKGVWYRSLDSLERGIISLAARVVDRVQNAVLGVEIVKILAKLRDALKGELVRCIVDFGFRRVGEVARVAVRCDARAQWCCSVIA